MKVIPDAYKKVPMMFRAQVNGRSQLQYLDPEKRKGSEQQDVELWTAEWVDKAERISLDEDQDIQTETYGAKSYQISWRFVTNGGQDDGMLRPVIGASGIPFYPGSSMKGAFRHACRLAEDAGEIPLGTCNYYCGDESEITPGALRFLGAYPINDWTKGLLDLVYPQQGWQVKTVNTRAKPKGAYAQVSLYQPILRFAISSSQPLSIEQWQQIWHIWERAIAAGLGSKVSGGYGQITKTSHPVIYRVKLQGQGQAAKLIDDTGEFRHNIFRASLRGHALRILGGLTNAKIADELVEGLFGGIQSKDPKVGLLGFQFQELKCDEINSFGKGKYAQPAYQAEGQLTWFLARELSNTEQVKILKNLVAKLMQFAMLVGGFGKSWRRVDHRLFFEEYYEDSRKALIGCHWEWLGDKAKRHNSPIRLYRSPEQQITVIHDFFDSVRTAAKDWIQAQNIKIDENNWANNWRESWHPSRVQVWGRIAEDSEDSAAIRWFHSNSSLIYKKEDLTGKIGRIGRIWHRMYPLLIFKKDPQNPTQPIITNTTKYLELITIFPDDSDTSNNFLTFLAKNPENFQLLWGEQYL